MKLNKSLNIKNCNMVEVDGELVLIEHTKEEDIVISLKDIARYFAGDIVTINIKMEQELDLDS